MSFSVEPAALESTADGLRALREVVSKKYLFMIGNIAPIDGGLWISGLAEEVEARRSELGSTYALNAPMRSNLAAAGLALDHTAYDYRSIDTASAASHDAALREVEAPDLQFTTSDWESGLKTDGDAVVDPSAYDSLLADPGTSFEAWDSWTEILTVVEDIISLGFVTDLLPELGFWDPLSDFQEWARGDWAQMGRNIEVFNVLADSWQAFGEDVAGILQHLAGRWDGNAAAAAETWLNEVHAAVVAHAADLRATAGRLHALGQATLYELRAVLLAVEALNDLIPRPDPGWLIDRLIDSLVPGRLAGRIIGYLRHIDAIFALISEPIKGLTYLTTEELDLTIPAVDPYERLDVAP